jgi:hypothetical protein
LFDLAPDIEVLRELFILVAPLFLDTYEAVSSLSATIGGS